MFDQQQKRPIHPIHPDWRYCESISCRVTDDLWRETENSKSFKAIIARFAKDENVSMKKAWQVFAELRTFLNQAAVSPKGLKPPSQEIDRMWHTFIIFTKDYANFCIRNYGKFVHHAPMKTSSCNSDQGGSQEGGGMDCNSGGNA